MWRMEQKLTCGGGGFPTHELLKVLSRIPALSGYLVGMILNSMNNIVPFAPKNCTQDGRVTSYDLGNSIYSKYRPKKKSRT